MFSFKSQSRPNKRKGNKHTHSHTQITSFLLSWQTIWFLFPHPFLVHVPFSISQIQWRNTEQAKRIEYYGPIKRIQQCHIHTLCSSTELYAPPTKWLRIRTASGKSGNHSVFVRCVCVYVLSCMRAMYHYCDANGYAYEARAGLGILSFIVYMLERQRERGYKTPLVRSITSECDS